MPAPRPWVCIHRVRLKDDVEPIYWFSPTPHPKADNTAVLQPYAAGTIARELGCPKQKGSRPSGHDINLTSFQADNGGSIPGTLLSASPEGATSAWRRAVRAAGLPLHPAIMPPALADRVVRLTTVPGDLVYDPFFGSGITGRAAESLDRHFIGTDRSLAYLQAAALRFHDTPGFINHLPPAVA